MKKHLLILALAIGFTTAAHAQVNLIRLGVNSATLAHRLANGGLAKPDKQDKDEVTASTFQGQTFPIKRTAAGQVTGLGADQIMYMEKQLEQCHAALLAASTGSLYTAPQLAQLQSTLVTVKQVREKWNTKPYADELAFYVAEQARRQPATSAAK